MALFELDTKEVGLLLGELEKRSEAEKQHLLSLLPSAAIGALSSLLSDAQAALSDISALHQKLSSAPVEAAPLVDAPATGVPLVGVHVPADGVMREFTLDAAPVPADDLAETPTESLPVVPVGPPDASLLAPSEAS